MISLRLLGMIAAVVFSSQMSFGQQPPAIFAVAHIANRSTAISTVYYKWGQTGTWRRTVIDRGESRAFSYRYNGNNHVSPPLFVRIDVDTQGSKWVEHELSRGASPDDNAGRFGHHFVITQVPNTDTRYITGASNGARVEITDADSSEP